MPEPEPTPTQVKLRVDYCGICATDVEEYLYGPVFIASGSPHPLTGRCLPLVVGHEIAGTVVEVGGAVPNVGAGARVVVNGVLSCGTCSSCRRGLTTQCARVATVGFGIDGGLAEYMVWPAAQVIELPASIGGREAALVEPASVAVHAVERSRLRPNECVAILGVGTIGTLALQAARGKGARVFAVDRRQMCLDLATQLGAEAAVNPDTTDVSAMLRELTGGLGPDVVIDAAGGRETPSLACGLVRRGGRVVLVAIYSSRPEFDFNPIVHGEIEVIGTLAYHQSDVETVVELMSAGVITTAPLVSGEIALDEVIEKGYGPMLDPSKDVFRIIVAPHAPASA